MMDDNSDHRSPVFYGLELSPSSKDRIENFCEDFEIENMVSRDLMILPLAVVTEFGQRDPEKPLRVFTGSVALSDFSIETLDVDGKKALVARYNSPVMDYSFKALQHSYESLSEEEPDLDFMIAFDYKGDMTPEELETKFNQYAPLVVASSDISGEYPIEVINEFLVGYKEGLGE